MALLVASFVLHTLAMWIIPALDIDPLPPSPKSITVELEPPKPPPPPPIEKPVEMPPPPEKKEVTPPKPPKPTPVPQTPVPVTKAPAETPAPVTPPPPVMAVAPKAEAQPVVTAPVAAPPTETRPPEPVKAPVQSNEDIDALHGKVKRLLEQELAKRKDYPAIAKRRGMQGKAMIELHWDDNGNIVSVKIVESSTYSVLDNKALEMVKASYEAVLTKDLLRGGAASITIPVEFKLAEP